MTIYIPTKGTLRINKMKLSHDRNTKAAPVVFRYVPHLKFNKKVIFQSTHAEIISVKSAD